MVIYCESKQIFKIEVKDEIKSLINLSLINKKTMET